MPDISRHLELSKKVPLDDLDWELCRRAGLNERERRLLPYFSDIEDQTVFYALELLKLKPARDPDTLAFITIWNYEEHYHARAFFRVLEECGIETDRGLICSVRQNVTLRARIEDLVQITISRLMPRAFVALWMAWGASQELLTQHGYDQLARSTQNPVLAEVSRRIAKQERRHFAFYYNSARERLSRSRFSQRFTRFMFERFWTPVGTGVKSEREVAQMVTDLFPGPRLAEVSAAFDAKLSRLPGLEGLDVMTRYSSGLHTRLPPGPAPVDTAPENA